MHNLGKKSLDRASWDLDVDKSVWTKSWLYNTMESITNKSNERFNKLVYYEL